MPLEVHIVTPEREVWAGAAEMLIARGVDGEVGILAGHAPLLVQLAIGSLRVHRDGGEVLAAVVDGGFLHVGTHEGLTRADVLASGSELANEIDIEAARRVVEQLQSKDAAANEDEQAASQVELQKAQARVSLAG
ncbi:MAG: F0F1 ATP synthase subunit epsilon [Actinomycetota bacterium]